MNHKKDEKPLDLDLIDKWLETFFLDPLTTYLDETIFRIDLFETAEEFIVEALLPEYMEKDLFIFLKEDKVLIEARDSKTKSMCKQRMISFPFSVINHDVTAKFESGILEVFISKYINGNGKNRGIHIISK
jgi:HSP20 family molecular chaperone IbpA